MFKKIFLSIIFISISFNSDFAQDKSSLRYEDKVRIREALNIGRDLGDKIWSGYNSVPYALLFVSDSLEFLINHPDPTKDFTDIGYDTVLHAEIYSRPRKFPANFLATFPAVGMVSTIVVGSPENAKRSSGTWILSVLHEHLHQVQYSGPEYRQEVDDLDLKNGDTTVMWMLNFPFPYASPYVTEEFSALMAAAQKTAFAQNDESFKKDFDIYIKEREKFKGLLSEKEYRYFSFQLWQEGIAMYTELKFAELMKDNRTPGPGMETLTDFAGYRDLYEKKLENIKNVSVKLKLNDSKRACFYYLGALEGLILDRENPGWRQNYFTDKFYLEKYYK